MTEPCHVPVVIVPIDARDERVATPVFTNVPDVGSVTFVAPVVVSRRRVRDADNGYASHRAAASPATGSSEVGRK